MTQVWRKLISTVTLASLAACGGGGGGSTGSTGSTGGTTTGGQTSAGCSLVERENWAFGVLKEWYLFPETLPSSLSTAGYTTVPDYIDALTATARSQRRDRYFTYLTSIADETAYYTSGSSAGFGFRVATDATAGTATITEGFETAPAYAAGIDRGDRIDAIGTTTADLRTVSSIIASEGVAGVTNAFGPTTAGVTRVLRVIGPSGTRTVSVTKADYSLEPLSPRYGVKVIDDGGHKVGYINLRTFITTADAGLRDAFANFKSQGVTEVVIDLRYNGGGLVATAELIGDLLGANRFTSDIFDKQTFRPEKTSNNVTRTFQPSAQSIAPTRIAFIGTGATASASELVINGMVPYLGTNMALVGANTYGKPVGQIAIDKSSCDDRLRVIAFATQNGSGNANYFDGLATTVPVTCRAGDDATKPLGDVTEASLRAALDFVEGKPCSAGAIASGEQVAQSAHARELLTPLQPTVAQREVTGLF
ncbi:Tail specific protease domain-containing protein [Sphingomonas antarctica]|uniref:S41 family peptidase n=1 Tax=Sphingomonas antarctica TaxID=2040274 RepID=UPI0039ED1614